MIIRKINSIINHYGLDPHQDSYDPLFIVKDEGNNYGMDFSDGSVFLKKEYDSITALGYGLWLLCHNGLFGIVTLGDDELCEARNTGRIRQIYQFKREMENTGMKFCIMDYIPCQYDYIEGTGGAAVRMCHYDRTKSNDVYFRNTGRIMNEVSSCDFIEDSSASSFYFLSRKSENSEEYEEIFYNDDVDRVSILEKDFDPVSGGITESGRAFYLTCCKTGGEEGIVYKLAGTKVIRSPIFDGIPTEIKPFEGEDIDEPIFYVGKKNGKTRIIDGNFKEVKGFKRLKVIKELVAALLEYSK